MGRKTGHVFEVDEDRCFGCAACIALCPVDALWLDGIMVYVNEPECTHCELCIPACPVFALNIVEEKGKVMV
jgi:electron transport complex protein RnfB